MSEEREHLRAFAARLELVRRRHGAVTKRPRLSMAQFANELGIHHSRYRRYERGELQPPLDVMTRLRRVTGVSLEWLICDEEVKRKRIRKTITVGQRLTWARELMEPFAPSCAAIMGVATALWQRYEDDKAALPVDVARQFADRFAVDLDYLYSGRLSGVAPVVRECLEERHPELTKREADVDLKSTVTPRLGAKPPRDLQSYNDTLLEIERLLGQLGLPSSVPAVRSASQVPPARTTTPRRKRTAANVGNASPAESVSGDV